MKMPFITSSIFGSVKCGISINGGSVSISISMNLYNYKAAGQEILMPEIGADGQYVPDPNKPGHYKMQHIAHDIGGTSLPTLGIIIEM